MRKPSLKSSPVGAQRPGPVIPPHLATALALAALEVDGGGGRRSIEARAKLGRALVAINGAPLMFKGPLVPDGETWPRSEVDPYVTACQAEFAPPPPPAPVAFEIAPDGDTWKWRAHGPAEMWSPPYDTREEAEAAALERVNWPPKPGVAGGFAHDPERCPSQHWNRGDDVCADCGECLA